MDVKINIFNGQSGCRLVLNEIDLQKLEDLGERFFHLKKYKRRGSSLGQFNAGMFVKRQVNIVGSDVCGRQFFNGQTASSCQAYRTSHFYR
jgi:hypothetical protein